MTDAPGLQPREGQLFGRLDGRPRAGAPGRRWQARLDDWQVRELRRMREAGWTYARLAAHFGITPSACYSIVTRQTYKHVGEQ